MAKLITVHNTKGMAYYINPEYIVSILPVTKEDGCTRIYMAGQQRWIPVMESPEQIRGMIAVSGKGLSSSGEFISVRYPKETSKQ